ncbi:MAG: hypothetical protein K8R53_08225 [Bacteroidales bacterium]|nr:hypothetical protein [Bacteroidales bacterium]
MKNTVKLIVALTLVVLVHSFVTAQPLPYDVTVGGGEGSNPVGGGAPLDGGLSIMIALGLGYIARKARLLKK